MGDFGDDERAVSESAGVAILIGITILVTGTVGMHVLVTTELNADAGAAEFSYDHVESSGALIITHVEGREYPAGELLIEGENAETTWAAAAEIDESESVGPGDLVQIRESNSYGAAVLQKSEVRIYHDTGQNRTQLSEWPE